ncbi:MAG: hypothetical protein Fur0044_48530 [Anaerolineae bacterium]
MAEAIDLMPKQGKDGQEGHHPEITQAQPWPPLTAVGFGWVRQTFDTLGGETAIVAQPLDVQETSIDLSAHLL